MRKKNSESPRRAVRDHGSRMAARSRTTPSRNTNFPCEPIHWNRMRSAAATRMIHTSSPIQNGSCRNERTRSIAGSRSRGLPWKLMPCPPRPPAIPPPVIHSERNAANPSTSHISMRNGMNSIRAMRSQARRMGAR